jgi:excisionase family DNA binding protein
MPRDESLTATTYVRNSASSLSSLSHESAVRPPRAGDDDGLLTVHDAARLLNVSVSWVYEHTRRNVEDRLPCVKLGKYLRFDRADLRMYVDSKRAASRRQPHRR